MLERLSLSVVALGIAVYLALQVVRLRRVWRGESLSTLPWPNMHGPEVNHRSFPVFTGFAVSFAGGILLMILSYLLGRDGPGTAGVVMVLVSVIVLLPLWIVVNALNRPRVLVPPRRRGEHGWVAQRRRRHHAQREGRPSTDHVVEVLDIRPPSDEKRPWKPYFLAVCSSEDCDWSSDPIGLDDEHPDPERSVREQAATHSAHLAGTHRPLG